jgi:hypothetical protein
MAEFVLGSEVTRSSEKKEGPSLRRPFALPVATDVSVPSTLLFCRSIRLRWPIRLHRLRPWCRRNRGRSLETRCSLGRPLAHLSVALHFTIRRRHGGAFPSVPRAQFPGILIFAEDIAVRIRKNVVLLRCRAGDRGGSRDYLPLRNRPVARFHSWLFAGFTRWPFVRLGDRRQIAWQIDTCRRLFTPPCTGQRFRSRQRPGRQLDGWSNWFHSWTPNS